MYRGMPREECFPLRKTILDFSFKMMYGGQIYSRWQDHIFGGEGILPKHNAKSAQSAR